MLLKAGGKPEYHVIFLLLYLSVVSSNPCERRRRTAFPHEEACENYYYCKRGAVKIGQCPSGTVFDEQTKSCQKNTLRRCRRQTTPAPATPCPQISTTTENPLPICTDYSKIQLLADVEDCKSYYICIWGDRVHRKCLSDWYFSPSKLRCVPKHKADCAQPTTNANLTTSSATEDTALPSSTTTKETSSSSTASSEGTSVSLTTSNEKTSLRPINTTEDTTPTASTEIPTPPPTTATKETTPATSTEIPTPAPTTATEATTPSPTTDTEATTPSPITSTEATTPSLTTTTEVMTSSPTSSTKVATASPTTTTEATTLSPITISEATTPSPTTATRVATPSPTTISEAPTSSPTTNTEVATPSSPTTTEEPAPSPTTTTEAITPSPTTTRKVTTLSPITTTDVATPSPTTIIEIATPPPTTITEAITPSPSTTKATTPSPITTTVVATPSPTTITEVATPPPTTTTKASTPSPTTTTKVATALPTTTTEVATPSPTTATKVVTPSPTTFGEVATPSLTTFTEVATELPPTTTEATTLSPITTSEATTPSPTTATRVATPSPTTISEAPTSSPTATTDVATPSPTTTTEVATPSPTTTTEATTLSPITTPEATTPSPTTATRVATPSPTTISEAPTSSPTTTTEVATPSPTTTTEATTLSPITISEATTPSPTTATRVATSSPTTISEAPTSSPTTSTEEATPSSTTTTEVATPSPTTTTEATTLSPITISEATTPSPTTATRVATPSPTTISEAPSSSPTTTTEEATPSPTTTTEVATPSPTTTTEATTLSPITISEATTPSPTTATRVATPSPTTISEAPTSSPTTTTEEATPSPTTTTEVATPSPTTATEAITPSPTTTIKATTPSPITTTDVATPSLTTTNVATTPSPKTTKEVSTPSPTTITEVATSPPTTTTEATTPSPSTTTEVATALPTTDTEVATPPSTTTTEATTPSLTTTTKVTTALPTTTTEASTPSLVTSTKVATPVPTTTTKVPTPSQTTISEAHTPSPISTTEVATPHPTTSIEETTPSLTTTARATTSSPTTSTVAITQSPTSTAEVITPSPTTTPKATTPSPPTTAEAIAPSSTTISEAPTPSPTTIIEIATPSPTTTTELATPPPTTTTEATTPASTKITKVATPSPTTTTEEATPSPTTTTELTKSSPTITTESSTPSPTTSTKVATAVPTTTSEALTPSQTTRTESPIPSLRINTEVATSPSITTTEEIPASSTATTDKLPQSSTTITQVTTPLATVTPELTTSFTITTANSLILPPLPHCEIDTLWQQPDYFDCRRYYECHFGQIYHVGCPRGNLFSPTELKCLPDELVNCQIQINPSTTTTVVDTTNSVTTPTTSTPFCGAEDQWSVPSDEDSSTYYVCFFGKIEVKRCPSGYEFSPDHQKCQKISQPEPENENKETPEYYKTQCSNILTVQLWPDVKDCGYYYACLFGDLVHRECLYDRHFSASKLKCLPKSEADCEKPSSKTTTENRISTTTNTEITTPTTGSPESPITTTSGRTDPLCVLPVLPSFPVEPISSTTVTEKDKESSIEKVTRSTSSAITSEEILSSTPPTPKTTEVIQSSAILTKKNTVPSTKEIIIAPSTISEKKSTPAIAFTKTILEETSSKEKLNVSEILALHDSSLSSTDSGKVILSVVNSTKFIEKVVPFTLNITESGQDTSSSFASTAKTTVETSSSSTIITTGTKDITQSTESATTKLGTDSSKTSSENLFPMIVTNIKSIDLNLSTHYDPETETLNENLSTATEDVLQSTKLKEFITESQKSIKKNSKISTPKVVNIKDDTSKSTKDTDISITSFEGTILESNYPSSSYYCGKYDAWVKPDYNDCKFYYSCVNGIKKHNQCPINNLFSRKLSICVQKTVADCEDSAKISIAEAELSIVQPQKSRLPKCDLYREWRFPDVTDCKRYYNCSRGNLYHKTCPKHHIFNPVSLKCFAGESCFATTEDKSTEISNQESPSTVTKIKSINLNSSTHYDPGTETSNENLSIATEDVIQSTKIKELITKPQGSVKVIAEISKPTVKNIKYDTSESTKDTDISITSFGGTILESNYPSSSFYCGKYDAWVKPDYNDCKFYYSCVNGIKKHNQCPINNLFSKKLSICVYKTVAADCEDSAKISIAEAELSIVRPGKSKLPKCDLYEEWRFPDVTDCKRYYNCSRGNLYHKTCPKHHTFNPVSLKCFAGENCFETTEDKSTEISYQESPSTVTKIKSINLNSSTHYDPETETSNENLSIATEDVLQNTKIKELITEPQGSVKVIAEISKPAVKNIKDDTSESTKDAGLSITSFGGTIIESNYSSSSYYCGKSDVWVKPDYNDCKFYYSCVNGIKYHNQCPINNLFSRKLSICIHKTVADCEDSAKISIAEAELSIVRPGNSKLPKCHLYGDWRFPDVTDCKRYYNCSRGHLYHKTCPKNHTFNPVSLKCIYSKDENCFETEKSTEDESTESSYQELPVCGFNTSWKIADLNDCKYYYKCKFGKVYHLKCSRDYLFSHSSLTCLPERMVDCYDANNPSTKIPAPTTTEPTTTQAVDVFPVCGSEQLWLIPDYDDKTFFFICIFGKVLRDNCLAGHEFNPKEKACRKIVHGSKTVETYNTRRTASVACKTFQVWWQPYDEDCSKYYFCNMGTLEEKSCRSGYNFSPTRVKCLPAAEAGCTKPNRRTPGPPNNPLPPCDLLSNWQEPDPTDCSAYYTCLLGNIMHKRCTSGYKFNQVTKQCEVDTENNCQALRSTRDSSPPRECNIFQIYWLPDKNDCNKYYFCNNGEFHHKRCRPGYHFSPIRLRCQPKNKAECVPVPTTPTIPTTPSRPSTLTIPTSPSTPTIPTIPTTPTIPTSPSTPTTPTISTTPTIPTSPSTPKTPTIPSTPSTPKTPTIPTIPSIPTTPTIPTIPSIPTTPTIPTIPSIPTTPTIPTTPSIPTTPTIPTTLSTPKPLNTKSRRETCENGTMLPDLENCKDYLICLNGKIARRTCPEDYEFSPSNQQCQHKSQSDCSLFKSSRKGNDIGSISSPGSEITISSRKSASSAILSSISTTNVNTKDKHVAVPKEGRSETGELASEQTAIEIERSESLSRSSGIKCDGTSATQYHPDPDDCTMYFECSYLKRLYHRNCSKGLEFSAELLKCVSPREAKCNSICKEDGTYFVPDSKDKAKYYICVNKSPLPQKCPHNFEFNPATLECTTTAECFKNPKKGVS